MARKSNILSKRRNCCYIISFLNIIVLSFWIARILPNAVNINGQILSQKLGDFPRQHSEKYLNCSDFIKFGDNYGGWTICRPMNSSFHMLQGAIVYSVGIGRNIQWDEGMLQFFGTVHHGWDPTPTASDYFSKRSVPERFYFHRYGLAATDGQVILKLPFGNKDSYTVMEHRANAQTGTITSLPMLSLKSMMRTLGHSWLAILKMDIEGAEFDVIDSWYTSGFEIPADQVLVEFHDRYFKHQQDYKRKVPDAIRKMSRMNFTLSTSTNQVSHYE